MTTVHEQVRAALDRLRNDEAEELPALIRQVEWRRSDSASLRRLAADPSFNVPAPRDRTFRHTKPVLACASLGFIADAVHRSGPLAPIDTRAAHW